MFRRYDNLKRCVALCGVMLALLSGMEHSHWLCYWGACAYAEGEATSPHHGNAHAADHCRHVDQAALSCRASCCCASHSQNSFASDSDNHNDNHTGPQRAASRCPSNSCPAGPCPSSPCPSGCWCQQAPQPLELPRESTQSSEVLLHGFWVTHSVSTPGICDPIALLSEDVGAAIATASAAERCAKLCRFLI